MIPVFETVLVEDRRIRLRDLHLARLARSGAPPERVIEAGRCFDNAVAIEAKPFVLRVDVDDNGVRTTTRAPRPADPVDLPIDRSYDPTLAIRLLKIADRGWVEEVEHAAGSEALLISADELVGESTRASVIVVMSDGTIAVPRLRGILAGVTREWAVAEAAAEERDLLLVDLLAARGAALLTAGRGVVMIATIDRQPIAIDPLLAALSATWRALP